MAQHSPIVFRGRVLTITPSSPHPGDSVVAKFNVDRWYRGKGPAEVLVPFEYGSFVLGHNCIFFRPGEYWLVFAAEKNGQLTLMDDCEGALLASPLLGPSEHNAGWLRQMEVDFVAGLKDPNPAARLISIQRLGGLKLPSSRDALRRFIENGSEDESKWATYAILRTGDISVLPRVGRLLANGDDQPPEFSIAMELQRISDPKAVPDLIEILRTAPGETTRTRVLIALGDTIRDRRAVPILAIYLSDPDPHARFDALDGLKNITKEAACTLSADYLEADIDPRELRCKRWWDRKGKFENWGG